MQDPRITRPFAILSAAAYCKGLINMRKFDEYASYPEGYDKLRKDVKMPFFLKFMAKKSFEMLMTILIDG